MPMTPNHWAEFNRVLQEEATRRGIGDLGKLFNLIQTLWDDLKTEDAARRKADTLELERLNADVPKAEAALNDMKTRQTELTARPLP